MSRPRCPIELGTQEILIHSRGMMQALRRLRRELRACEQCELCDDCPVLRDFNSQVNQAVQEIADEWNLAQVLRLSSSES